MPIWMAFVTLTLLWGSTPLAVQWSQDGVGYLFAATARMAIGVVLFLLLIPWLKRRPAPPRQVVMVAMISGLSMFVSMFGVYWGAQYVPSGWIAVLFGLGPILTGIMAATWLKEPFPKEKILGSLLGLIGLMLFFFQGESLGEQAPKGIAAIIGAVIIYAAGNIGIKRWNHNISPFWVTAGSLWVAFPFFLASWLLAEIPWPVNIPVRTGTAILYLGLVANGIGFVCFYYLLSRVSAANATLVTLTAPAVALWIGAAFNQEPIHGSLVVGTLFILGGLSLFQWGLPLLHRRTL
ncbi:MAG: DMT family transporter [Magnetococcus sp. YQC-5]